MNVRRSVPGSAVVIASVMIGSIVLAMVSSSAAPSASHAPAASEPDLAVYFGETVSETDALTLLQNHHIQHVESSYDTTHIEVGVIVPPTQKQFDALRAHARIWTAEIDGAGPRDNDAVLSPEREARLEKKRRAGAICPTIYLRATAAPHVSKAAIRSWIEQIPTAGVPSIRKPANDIHVAPKTPEGTDTVYALESLPDVQFVALAE